MSKLEYKWANRGSYFHKGTYKTYEITREVLDTETGEVLNFIRPLDSREKDVILSDNDFKEFYIPYNRMYSIHTNLEMFKRDLECAKYSEKFKGLEEKQVNKIKDIAKSIEGAKLEIESSSLLTNSSVDKYRVDQFCVEQALLKLEEAKSWATRAYSNIKKK